MKLDAQTILVIFVLLQIGLQIFKRFASSWHYDSDKPHWWIARNKEGKLGRELKQFEQASDDKVRLYNFAMQVARLDRDKVPGAMAELGVYQGETAAWLHELAPERAFHLFDTFTGFAEDDLVKEIRSNKYQTTGYFADTSLEAVQKRLGPSPNLHYHPGYFPDTAAELPEQPYALVHLDADLYWPTLQALQYFYPRLSPGGAIIVHDYNHIWAGVRQALDEFMATIPEVPVEIPDRQGSVMIIRNKGV